MFTIIYAYLRRLSIDIPHHRVVLGRTIDTNILERSDMPIVDIEISTR